MAGYFNGLLSLIGVNAFFQTCLCLCSLVCKSPVVELMLIFYKGCASSVLHLLWFKCYIVLPVRHWLRNEWLFTKGLFAMYPLWVVFSAWCYLFMSAGMEEQWIGSLQRMTATPAQLYDDHLPGVFLVARRQQSTSFKFINVAIGRFFMRFFSKFWNITVAYVLLCFVAYFWARHLINKLPTSSEKTKKMQKRAMRALGLQVLFLFQYVLKIF